MNKKESEQPQFEGEIVCYGALVLQLPQHGIYAKFANTWEFRRSHREIIKSGLVLSETK